MLVGYFSHNHQKRQALGEIAVPNLLQLKGDEGHRKWCLVVETGQGPVLGRKRLWGLEIWWGLHDVRTLSV